MNNCTGALEQEKATGRRHKKQPQVRGIAGAGRGTESDK